MLASDLLGGAGGLVLAVPAVKDQFYRFQTAVNRRRESTSPWPGLRKVARQAWEAKRNDFNGLDSALTGLGALLLFASFVLKMLAA